MNVDHAFEIGSSHKVCEDYARSFVDEKIGKSCALISDGCSSSKDTDIGARVIVSAAERFIKRNVCINRDVDIVEIVSYASAVQKLMGIRDTALDATLFGINSSENGVYRIFGVGDGVIVIKNRTGELIIDDIEFPSGYPIYPSYLLNDDRMIKVDSDWFIDRYFIGSDEDGYRAYERKKRTGFDIYVAVSAIDESESVAIFSDGVKSFMDEDKNPIHFINIVRELMSFKGHNGEFVKRRFQGFNRMCKKSGWTHYDDVSMAAMYFG